QELVAVLALEARERGGSGTEDADAFAVVRRKVFGKLARIADGFVEIGVADDDVGERGERRIGHDAAEGEFALEKGSVVLADSVLHGVVIGIVGLDENAAREIAAAGAAGNLREELEGALGGAEVWHRE